MSTYGKIIGGGNGTYSMNIAGTKTINFYSIDIPTTVTITSLLDKDGNEVKTSYALDITSAIPTGYIYVLPEHSYFTKIVTSAGDCILNLTPKNVQ